jgi:hydroxymethylpyrimidine pyrophosphatase-like HAD family hydrolase
MSTVSFKGARLARPLLLSLDLDETFAASPAEARADLFALFEAHADEVQLVYTSHEPAEKLIEIAASAELPVPAMFMADTGTTVLKGDASGTVEPLQRNIIQLWPGKESVQKALGDASGVSLIDDGALCRQSVKAESEEAMQALQEKVAELGCHYAERGENEYYVLPYGVDKGTTLGRYLVEANVNPNDVLAIGEAEGDDCLFGRGWRGAAFGHAVASVKDIGNRFHNVVVLDESGAPAVLEALRQHNWLELAQND